MITDNNDPDLSGSLENLGSIKDSGEVFNVLLMVMSVLRSDRGCVWDREQTHQSLAPHLMEESYEALHALGLQSMTVRVSGRNLALWTDYSGTDPETNLTGPTNGQGLDYFNNPSVRSWVLSLQVDY